MDIKKVWQSIREIVAQLKKDESQTYKEIWIPGFEINEENTLAKNFIGGMINGQTIRDVLFHFKN